MTDDDLDDDALFVRAGWAPEQFRIRTADDLQPVRGWVTPMFGLHWASHETSVGRISVVSVTHLESGFRLCSADELATGAIAVDALDRFYPESLVGVTTEQLFALGDRCRAAWREAELVPSGVTIDGSPILHTRQDPRSRRLLQAVMQHAIKTREQRGLWSDDIAREIAISVKDRFPVLVEELEVPELFEMVKGVFARVMVEEATRRVMDRHFAAAGITGAIAAAKADELIVKFGNTPKAKKKFVRWFSSMGRRAQQQEER